MEVALILAPTAGASWALRRWMPRRGRALLPAALASVWGIALFTAAYIWVFDPGSCQDHRAFACRVNTNQGVLTLYSLILAVAAVWATLVTRELDERRREEAADAAFATAVGEFVSETAHNLIHVADAFRRDHTLTVLPQINRLCASRLLEPEFAARLRGPLKPHANAVYRNGELLVHITEWDADFEQKPPLPLRVYTRSSLLAILYAVRLHPDVCSAWAAESRYARDFVRLAGEHVHGYFYSSGAERDAAHLRSEDATVLCWWKDKDIDGVTIVEEGLRFKDLREAR